ncbi:hypothetical protein ACO2Q9_18195 [Variovorax sp. VNK109]|uniref:hypothetical protein n=1 Tax=Variovorax sp. VNK109 TaxID=3400919 RepID=UPI003C04D8F7
MNRPSFLSWLVRPQILSMCVVAFSLLAVACLVLRSVLGLNTAIALTLAWAFIIVAALAAIGLMLVNRDVGQDDTGDSKIMS